MNVLQTALPHALVLRQKRIEQRQTDRRRRLASVASVAVGNFP